MTEELRKRLEEAAENTVSCDRCQTKEWLSNCRAYCTPICAFIRGAEWMWKESGGETVLKDMREIILAQCKEWLNNHWDISDYNSIDEFVSDFEADMKKLWEGTK